MLLGVHLGDWLMEAVVDLHVVVRFANCGAWGAVSCEGEGALYSYINR